MREKLKLYEVDLQTEITPDLSRILSAEEWSLAEKIRNEGLKKRHIAVRIAVRQILAAYLNQASEKINIAKTVYGKPYLVDFPEIEFNISHSADTLLIAISQIGAVGVDIEQVKPQQRDFSALVAKCFAEPEIAYWNALADSRKVFEFYRFWTRKEAFAKAVGRGLAMGLQECVIAPETPAYFLSIPEAYGQPSDWRLFDLPLKMGLYGAVVLRSGKISSGFVLPEIILFDGVKI